MNPPRPQFRREPRAKQTASRASHQIDVLFYLPWIGPLLDGGEDLPPGGAETQVFLLMRELARRGHRVGVVSFETTGGLPDQVDGIKIIRRSPWKGRQRFVGKFLEAAAVWRAVFAADARVVVQRAAGVDTGLVALAVNARRRRFVYSSANIVDFDYGTLERKRRNVALFHLGVRLANEIVVQTDEQARLCNERFARTSRVIKSIAEIPPATPRSAEQFLWIGRLAPYKKPSRYLELARAVPEAMFRMVAVPSGQYAAALSEQLRQEGMETIPNLEILDPRPREALMDLVGTAVAIVNTADYEGMPNIFLEGWARGVPALALTHDPDGVIQREGLGGFAEGSPERLADLARDMWREHRDSWEMSERCRDYVRRQHAVEHVADLWSDALGLEMNPTAGQIGGVGR